MHQLIDEQPKKERAGNAWGVDSALYEELSFDFIRDIAPVASIGGAAIVMVSNAAALPAASRASWANHCQSGSAAVRC
jgi:hypothetical protein